MISRTNVDVQTPNFALLSSILSNAKKKIKSAIYCFMRCVRRNINVQRMGLVGVNWTFGSDFESVKRRFLAHKRCMGALPLRPCAVHVCVPASNDAIVSFISNMYFMSINKEFRQRLRIHSGKSWISIELDSYNQRRL